MEKKMKSSATFERQHEKAKSLDEMVHSQLSRSSMGLSPISLAMASADWAMHMAASPGRQMVLAQRAVALAQQAMLAAAINCTRPGCQPPTRAEVLALT